ncbi:MAG: PilN domain-containing protein [Proteobacteria bacterium]|nr:PilN domain-containing protein [Pseudomonadota bacterium]
MRPINLATKPKLYPLTQKIQSRLSVLIFLLLIVYFSLKILFLNYKQKELAKDIDLINKELIQIREMISQRQQVLELKKSIEKEFSINIDKNMITNNSFISQLFNSLSQITPENIWITSLELKYGDEKFIRISGKSKIKGDIFIFMDNLKKIYRDVNLISMQNTENSIYNFQLRLDI